MTAQSFIWSPSVGTECSLSLSLMQLIHSICILSVCLSVLLLSVALSVCHSPSLSLSTSASLHLCLSLCLSVAVSVCLPFALCLSLSLSLSVSLCLCLSLSLIQLIHNTVIDTAIVFPHRLGLPYKRALRNLMADHLKRIIQDNGETPPLVHKTLCTTISPLFNHTYRSCYSSIICMCEYPPSILKTCTVCSLLCGTPWLRVT